MKRNLLLALLLLLQASAFSQILTITIPEHRYRIDPYDHIIVVQQQDLDAYADLSGYEEIHLELGIYEYDFITMPSTLEFTNSYLVSNDLDNYKLFFTRLPLLKIQSVGSINPGSRAPAVFSYADNQQILVADVGISLISSYLTAGPKKSYSVEFWTDDQSQIPLEVQFGDIEPNANWVMNSMVNDPLRIRTMNAHKLWVDMHQPFYLDQEPDAHAGNVGQYTETFLNGHYIGIFFLGEEITRDFLGLREFDGTIRGELYKGKEAAHGTLFTGLPAYNDSLRYWAGHTMILPADTTNWQNLYNFTDFVLNSDSLDFNNNIWSKFNYQNYLDYFIFLNVTRTADNTGKNIYLAKYDSGTPYFYVPAQLNGSFGTKWDGSALNITDDILTNGFMDRVIANNVPNYTADVNARWAELRSGPLALNNLLNSFTESYNLLKNNNVYAREAIVFPGYPFDQSSFDYTLNWIQDRIAFLDIYFNYVPDGVAKVKRTNFNIYPNPSADNFSIQSTYNLTNEVFQIIDLQGKVVKSGIYNGEQISVSDLESGFYIVTIKNLSEKIVIR